MTSYQFLGQGVTVVWNHISHLTYVVSWMFCELLWEEEGIQWPPSPCLASGNEVSLNHGIIEAEEGLCKCHLPSTVQLKGVICWVRWYVFCPLLSLDTLCDCVINLLLLVRWSINRYFLKRSLKLRSKNCLETVRVQNNTVNYFYKGNAWNFQYVVSCYIMKKYKEKNNRYHKDLIKQKPYAKEARVLKSNWDIAPFQINPGENC